VPARPIFIGGTASNAGKSWMATAICAWLRRRGVSVAPFKAQNMSNHSYPGRGGGEIGRAQVVQAEACGLEPEVAMNPVLLKPNGDGTSQVIVHGRAWRTLSARAYYRHTDWLRAKVDVAYASLARRFDVIVIEGAGSVTELNLRPYDFSNLALASRLGAPWVLVSDIERGGVFASVVGTFALLTAAERASCRGFLVNKFRGDRLLFDEGVDILAERTGAPCLGVFPFATDITLPAEDSLAVDVTPRAQPPAGARIAILRFPSLSNATDFRLLTWADWVTAAQPGHYDFIVLPGSKHVAGDLAWMRAEGLDRWIRREHAGGATIVGVCGGYQMLGEAVRDPAGVESPSAYAEGLGLLGAETMLLPEKTTRARRATLPNGTSFSAYEIHLGATTCRTALPPFARLEDGTPEGVRGERLIGTYLHGAFEDAQVCGDVFGYVPPEPPSREATFARLADWFDRAACEPDTWLPS
jgi:adenosylcobyric acid synthase